MGVVSGLSPLEDMVKRNTIYLALRDSVGFPDPPQADVMELKVLYMEYAAKRTLGSCD